MILKRSDMARYMSSTLTLSRSAEGDRSPFKIAKGVSVILENDFRGGLRQYSDL